MAESQRAREAAAVIKAERARVRAEAGVYTRPLFG